LINFSNIFRDNYDEFIQTEWILFEVLDISQFDVLNFEIKNIGSWNANVVGIFSGYSENSYVLSNPNSLVMNMVLLFIIFRFLWLLGLTLSIIGTIAR